MAGSRRGSPTQVASSVPFDNDSNGFVSDNVQDALEEGLATAQGFPRSGIRSTSNGTVGNNNWIGPTELLPNTPMAVFPVKVQINEITWSNQNTNVQFRIEFRSGSKTGTIFHTITVTSPNPGFGYEDGLAYNFNPGDSIWAQYKDDGTNMSDAEVTLWISRVP